MSRPPLPADAAEMLRRPNPCVMATVRPDGTPVTTATWYLWEDDHVVVSLDAERARLRHLRADPRVSFTVLAEDSWYSHVSLIGRVVELRDDQGMADINRISRHYGGSDYPDQERPRVTAVVEVERWHGWGQFRDSRQAAPGSGGS